MKKTLLTAIAAFGLMQSTNAQVVDTVITGPNYQNNVWYSLENDDDQSAQSTAKPANDWHIAISTSMGQTSELTTSILSNYKMGKVYAVAGSNPANFATFTMTPTEIGALTPLYNSDTIWTLGAFKNTPTITPGTDYGWGTYDQTSHSVLANRIFIVENTATSTFYKVMFDMVTMQGKYVVKHAEITSNTPIVTEIPMAQYSTKNFIYLSFSNTAGTIVDREPAATAWDLTFLQYNTSLGAMGIYPVAGVLQNHGVQVAKVHPVNSNTYVNWSAHSLSEKINSIGYNWKNSGQNGVTIEDSTVFFVKAIDGDLWKVVFTGFISGSQGGNSTYIFNKQKLETASTQELEANVFMTVYPNPANETATLVLDNQSASKIEIYNVLGALVYTTEVSANGLQTVNVPVSEFNNGIYHVICTSNGKTANQKLLVQH